MPSGSRDTANDSTPPRRRRMMCPKCGNTSLTLENLPNHDHNGRRCGGSGWPGVKPDPQVKEMLCTDRHSDQPASRE